MNVDQARELLIQVTRIADAVHFAAIILVIIAVSSVISWGSRR